MKLNKNLIILGAFLLVITSGSIALPIFFNDHNSISQNTEINSYNDDIGISLRYVTKKIEHTTSEENANKENVHDETQSNEANEQIIQVEDSNKDKEKDTQTVVEMPIEVVETKPDSEKPPEEDTTNDNETSNNEETSNESETNNDLTNEDDVKVDEDYIQELIEENKENIEEEDLETGNSIYEKLDTEFIFELVEEGLTEEEKKQIKDHMHEVLTDEEYEIAFVLFSKYIGLTD